MRVSVRPAKRREETVYINTDFIRLDGFLKFKGIAMTGGGSMLRGLDVAIRAATGLPAFLVDNPLACVACGSGKMLSNLDKNKHVLQTMY